jgi:hypothetical protein
MSIRALLALLSCTLAAAAQAQQERPPSKLPPSYWADGDTRPFVGVRTELGPYGAIEASSGYGRPHWMWVGVEAFALLTPDWTASGVGLRANLLAADLKLRARKSWSFSKGRAPFAPHHTKEDFTSARPLAEYTGLEADLASVLPTPGGYALLEAIYFRQVDAPAGLETLESYHHVVMRDALFLSRLGWAAALGQSGWLKLGVLSDVVATFGRGTTVRAGPLALVQLNDHLDLIGTLIWPVRSPDDLGFAGTFGTIRLRWSWASGELNPGVLR